MDCDEKKQTQAKASHRYRKKRVLEINEQKKLLEYEEKRHKTLDKIKNNLEEIIKDLTELLYFYFEKNNVLKCESEVETFFSSIGSYSGKYFIEFSDRFKNNKIFLNMLESNSKIENEYTNQIEIYDIEENKFQELFLQNDFSEINLEALDLDGIFFFH